MNKEMTRAIKLTKIAIVNDDKKNFKKHSAVVEAGQHLMTKEELKETKDSIKKLLVDSELKTA